MMDSAIEIENLSTGFDRGENLLANVTVAFKAENINAIVGNNGVGKTTFLRTLMGIQPINTGAIKILGADLRKLTQAELANKVCYVPNKFEYASHLRIYEFFYACQANRQVVDKNKISNIIDNYQLAKLSDLPITVLSTGEQRKVLILTALLFDCPIVLLDEPTSGLDPKNTLAVQKVLGDLALRSGSCIIQTTHNLNSDLQKCQQVYSCYKKSIYQEGSPKDFLKPENLERVFGVPFEFQQLVDKIYVCPK